MISRPAALRDERVLALAAQGVFALGGLLVLALVAQHVLDQMRASNLVPGLDFLGNTAGFGIAEGPAYRETDTYGRAFLVGLANTLRVSVAGVLLATGLGLITALARLSGNPLASRLAAVYIDVFRNTPLLVQLIFWYRGIVLQLPAYRDSIVVAAVGASSGDAGAWALLSRRGLATAWPVAGPGTHVWLAALALGLAAGWSVARWRARRAGGAPPVHGTLLGMATFLLVAGGAWLLLPGAPPAGIELPTTGRFRYQGGLQLTPEFTALLLGLTVYTGAFIAEVIRSGIQSVAKGQREAALAIGLREGQVLRLVILPQALRVIVPPLTSQYLNLIKNSSLGFYIGFQELFNITNTIGNQTGQFVVATAMAMAFYLGVSLLTSVLMNLYNRRTQLVER